MKTNRKIITKLNFIPVALSVTSLFSTVTSCSLTFMPRIDDVKIKPSKVYDLSFNGDHHVEKYVPSSSITELVDVYEFNNEEIPYINVDDYVNKGMDYSQSSSNDAKLKYSSSTSNHITTITVSAIEGYNSQKRFDYAHCYIDYKNQTITFDNLDHYFNNVPIHDNPLAFSLDESNKFNINIVPGTYYAPSEPYVIHLNQYNIKAYYYKDKGYLPYDLFRNILNHEVDRPYFYSGKDFYETYDYDEDILINLWKSQVINDATIIQSKKYAQFCYDLLALTLDFNWGLPNRKQRKGNDTISFLPNGAYATLEPYHNDLVSLDKGVSSNALECFIRNELDDGGHAGYYSSNILCQEPTEHINGVEHANTGSIMRQIGIKRDEKEYPSNKIFQIVEDGTGKTTVWANFSRFALPENPVLYSKVDETNYANDLVSYTMWLQKLIKADQDSGNPKIKNVIIDIASNGGGELTAEAFMASYLCGRDNINHPWNTALSNRGVTQSIYNSKTHSLGTYTVLADINQDGQYNEQDYLPDGINLYCIVSNGSFSCANALACQLKDCCGENVTFIGDLSGGGACTVETKYNYGFGSNYQISGHCGIVSNLSTLDNIIYSEEGVTPEGKYYISCQSEDIEKFADVDYLYSLIK